MILLVALYTFASVALASLAQGVELPVEIVDLIEAAFGSSLIYQGIRWLISKIDALPDLEGQGAAIVGFLLAIGVTFYHFTTSGSWTGDLFSDIAAFSIVFGLSYVAIIGRLMAGSKRVARAWADAKAR